MPAPRLSAASGNRISASYEPPPPTQTLAGDVTGGVTVGAGQSVLLTNARVLGAVTVYPGGALTVINSRLDEASP
jgi:hypothetical protein